MYGDELINEVFVVAIDSFDHIFRGFAFANNMPNSFSR